MATTTISVRGEAIASPGVRRALIVEDQLEISELLAQILDPLGFKTYIARNGVEATRLAGAVQPNLITLDLHLPVKDGHSVMRDLAVDPHTCTIPIIVISAYTGQLRPTKQVVGVLQKPFDVQDLLDTIAIATCRA